MTADSGFCDRAWGRYGASRPRYLGFRLRRLFFGRRGRLTRVALFLRFGGFSFFGGSHFFIVR